MRLYRYVGPEDIRLAALASPPGRRISNASELASFAAGAKDPWATYVVSAEGDLLAAPRRSEHVACAGGADVRSAGELCIDGDRIVEITNLSTGYCPEPSSWIEVERALDRAGIEHPDGFTYEATFRRCVACTERNVVKDGWFVCAICGAELPSAWNF
jgi:hypothetical protein